MPLSYWLNLRLQRCRRNTHTYPAMYTTFEVAGARVATAQRVRLGPQMPSESRVAGVKSHVAQALPVHRQQQTHGMRGMMMRGPHCGICRSQHSWSLGLLCAHGTPWWMEATCMLCVVQVCTQAESVMLPHHHHHHVTQSSHSINAIGPAPLWSGRKREHCSIMFATITHTPSLHKILSNTPRNHLMLPL
jgi:hypothetical protein